MHAPYGLAGRSDRAAMERHGAQRTAATDPELKGAAASQRGWQFHNLADLHCAAPNPESRAADSRADLDAETNCCEEVDRIQVGK